MIKITTIGGGSGSFNILKSLKHIEDLFIKAIVSVADDGGVAKKERSEFGILPQSDVRKCLIALSQDDKNDILRKMFTHRFYNAIGLEGVTLGNLMLAALTKITGSQYQAIKEIGSILDVKGRVIPTTMEKTNLLLTLENGQQIFGEESLDNVFWDGTLKIEKAELFPRPKLFNKAEVALEEAEYIIICPGDIYGSIIPNLLVKGFCEALKNSKAKIIYIANLVTKYGQTHNYTLSQHIEEIEKYLCGKKIDIILANNGQLPEGSEQKYSGEKSYPVENDIENIQDKEIYIRDLVIDIADKKNKEDKIERTLIRHDHNKLQKELENIIKN